MCVPGLIARLQQEMKLSKSPVVHARMSQYIFVLVTLYPFEGVLDKNAEYVDLYIK